jgi:hypothetical protein
MSWLLLFPLFTASLSAAPASASYGTPPSKLDWKTKSETLTYRSCGCADSCWIAELRNLKSKKLIVRLQCDCEKLRVSHNDSKPFGEAEIYRATCVGFDSEDKMEKITREIEQLARAVEKTKDGK